MKALILAGGFGTRLRPLTLTRPKHLLPIANRPHIEHVFDLLLKHDIDQAVLMTSYLAEAFADTMAGAAQRGMSLEITNEVEPLGTAGALKNAEHLVGDEPFLAFNGDVLTNVDLGAVLDFHRAREAEASIVLTPVEDPSAYGVVPTKEDGTVLGFIEKPPRGRAPTNLINAGIYVFEPSILDRIPPDRVLVGRARGYSRDSSPRELACSVPLLTRTGWTSEHLRSTSGPIWMRCPETSQRMRCKALVQTSCCRGRPAKSQRTHEYPPYAWERDHGSPREHRSRARCFFRG